MPPRPGAQAVDPADLAAPEAITERDDVDIARYVTVGPRPDAERMAQALRVARRRSGAA